MLTRAAAAASAALNHKRLLKKIKYSNINNNNINKSTSANRNKKHIKKSKKKTCHPMIHAYKRLSVYNEILDKKRETTRNMQVDYSRDLEVAHKSILHILKTMTHKESLLKKVCNYKKYYHFLKDTRAFDVNIWWNILNFLSPNELFTVMKSRILPRFDRCSFEHVKVRFFLSDLKTSSEFSKLLAAQCFNCELIANDGCSKFGSENVTKEIMSNIKSFKSLRLGAMDLRSSNPTDAKVSSFTKLFQPGFTSITWGSGTPTPYWSNFDKRNEKKNQWSLDLFNKCTDLKVFKSYSPINEDGSIIFDVSKFKHLEVLWGTDVKIINYENHKKLREVKTTFMKTMVDVINKLPNVKVAHICNSHFRLSSMEGLDHIDQRRRLKVIHVKFFRHVIDFKTLTLAIRLLLYGITEKLILESITMTATKITTRGATISIVQTGNYNRSRSLLGNIVKLTGRTLQLILTSFTDPGWNEYLLHDTKVTVKVGSTTPPKRIPTAAEAEWEFDPDYYSRHYELRPLAPSPVVAPSPTVVHPPPTLSDENLKRVNFNLSKYPVDLEINLKIPTEGTKWCSHSKYKSLRDKIFVNGKSFETIIKNDNLQ